MKKLILTGLLVFLAAAIVGYIIAAISGLLPPFPSRLPIIHESEDDQQQKTLVVLVDDLKSSDPVIESIWMIYGYPDSQPALVFLPVYSLRDQSAHPEIQTDFNFGLFGRLSVEFRESLQESYNLNWDKYLILDNQMFAQISTLLTGKKAPKLLAQPPNLEKPADYQATAIKYIKAYCSYIKSGKSDPVMIESWMEISPGFWTDIKQENLEASWAWFIEHPQKTPCNIVTSK